MIEEYTDQTDQISIIPFDQSIFAGIAISPVTDEQAAILMEAVNPDDLEILPTGEVYLPQVKYRARLNRAFRPGGWAMRPIGRPYILDNVAMQEWALYANGQFIAYTVGGSKLVENNERMQWDDVLETLKSNALMRLCKDLGIVSECWDRQFTQKFKREFCTKVWVEGKSKPQWRRLNGEPFYNETGMVIDGQQKASRSSKASNPQNQPAPENPLQPSSSVKANNDDQQKQPNWSNAAWAFFREIDAETGNYWGGSGWHFAKSMESLGLNWSFLNSKEERDAAKAALSDRVRKNREKQTNEPQR